MARRAEPGKTGRLVTPARRWAFPAWADNAARALLALYIALIAVPLRYHAVTPGLDASFALGLNWAAAHGLLHGRDVAFAYGPFAYLALPMDIGANLARGLFFQLAFWLLFAAMVALVAFVRRVPLYNLALFAVLLLAGTPLFHTFGAAGPDLFISLFVLLLLGGALEGTCWAICFGAAVATAVLLLFIKLSSGFQALSAIGLFAAGLIVLDRTRGRRAALLAAFAPVLFAVFYLLYCPSLAAMLRYLRATMEIASGFGTAMSQGDDASALRAALLIALAWTALTVVLWMRRQPAAVLALAGCGPLFMEFKHAFVRQAGHIDMFFLFLPIVLGVVLLFTAFQRRTWWQVAAPVTLLLALWYPYRGHPGTGLANARSLSDVLRLPDLRARLAAESSAALAADRLPAPLVQRIGARPITLLPWEIGYAAANPLNFRPLPIFGNYQAYTAFLDGWNAEALADPARAPACVLFDWVSIDDHHPLLEVPATSLALYRDYDLETVDGPHLLLRRRAAPRFTRLVFLGTRRVPAGEPLRYEDRGHPVVARIHLQPSPAGSLRRFLYRIPEVRAILTSPGGRSLAARVPPDVLPGGVALNFTPADLDEARALFARDDVSDPFDALALAGPGLTAYEPGFSADLYEIPEVALHKVAPPLPPPSALKDSGAAPAGAVELLNGHGVMDYGPNEVVDIPSQGYLYIEGWAIDPVAGAPAGGVWVEIDGRPYTAQYGAARPDIAAARGSQAFRSTGFSCTVPAWQLGTAAHTLAIKVVTAGREAYLTPPRRLRFRLSGA